MKALKWITALAMTAITATSIGQVIFSGSVNDKKDQPLPGAHVVIDDGPGTLTDENGRFWLSVPNEGKRWVEVSFIGYERKREEVQLSGGEVNRISFQLSPGEVILDDVVVDAGMLRPVNLLSQVDINLRPINTSQDILRMIPGLFIAQHAGGGKAEQIFLRGFDIDHGTDLLLEVDGLPVNMVSHAHGQGYSDLHFLLPEVISYVDFDTGPYYADKGDFNTAGYVSFVTKKILDENFVKAGAGSFGTFRSTAGINIGVDDGSGGYIAGEFFRSDGYFESPQDFSRINLMGKYTAQTKSGEFTFLASVFDSDWNASGQIPVRAVTSGQISRYGAIDDSEGGQTSRFQGSVRHQQYLRTGALLEQRLYAIRYDFKLFSNFTFYLNNDVLGDQIQQQESRHVVGYNVRYARQKSVLGKAWFSEIGGGVRYDDINDIFLANAVKRQFLGYIQRGQVDQVNAFAYVNERVDLTDLWSVNGGARIDFFSFQYRDLRGGDGGKEHKTIVSPKLTFEYRPSSNTELYMRAGIGFHSNDARVVVAQSGEDILPKAYGVDLGGNFKVKEKLLLHAALWRLDLEQEFVYVGDEGIVEPGGRTRRQGIDFGIRYQAMPSLFLDADLNVTAPRSKDDPEGENYIPLAPVFSSVGGMTYKTQKGLSGSLRYRYLSTRPANENNSVEAEGYFLADLVVRYSARWYEFGFSIENLFDMEWNEAQFDTESRLPAETSPVSEIHFTPGTPLFVKLSASFFW